MKLNTRSRYAVMALTDLAFCSAEKAIPLKDMAKRQGLSILYLEQLFSVLKRKGLVGSMRGPGGGYYLTKKASEVSIGRIIQALDDPIRVTRCKGQGTEGSGCLENKSLCATHHLWANLENHIWGYLNNITLEDVKNNFFPTQQRNFA